MITIKKHIIYIRGKLIMLLWALTYVIITFDNSPVHVFMSIHKQHYNCKKFTKTLYKLNKGYARMIWIFFNKKIYISYKYVCIFLG